MDREKNPRQGDGTVTNVLISIRHLSVLILGVRDEYHQIYILEEENGSELMEDVFLVEESQQPKCCFLCSMWSSFLKPIMQIIY